MSNEKNKLVGKTVKAVYLAKDKQAIKFDVKDRDPIVARADADCCSRTWIEEVQGVEQLVGATVVSVEDVEMPNNDKSDDGEYIQFYGCKIVTDKGFCLIDFRNESNGYYGGSLVWPVEGREPYFYGGVFGQNKSDEEWEKIS